MEKWLRMQRRAILENYFLNRKQRKIYFNLTQMQILIYGAQNRFGKN